MSWSSDTVVAIGLWEGTVDMPKPSVQVCASSIRMVPKGDMFQIGSAIFSTAMSAAVQTHLQCKQRQLTIIYR